jgi:hypothetical protein
VEIPLAGYKGLQRIGTHCNVVCLLVLRFFFHSAKLPRIFLKRKDDIEATGVTSHREWLAPYRLKGLSHEMAFAFDDIYGQF